MPGSTTTRGRHMSRDIDTCRVAFCGTENISTQNLSYAAQYLACALPCGRFTSALADSPCITRGQCGSLLLHRDGLPPSAFCRSPGAPVHGINNCGGSRSLACPFWAATASRTQQIFLSIDHHVRDGEQTWRHLDAERSRRWRLRTNSNFVDCTTGKSAGPKAALISCGRQAAQSPDTRKANLTESSGLRTQKPSERFKRRFRYVMLDPFGVSFSSFDGYTHRDKYIHDEPMAGSYSRR